MTIQYAAGPERKRLAAAAAEHLGTKSRYAAAPTMNYVVGPFTLSREWALTGPDDRDLVAALAERGFVATEEAYDAAHGRLTVEVPVGGSFTPAKMANLENLIACRAALLKKVLGADALPIERGDGVLWFPWFQVDGNAMVYSQLARALVRAATEATRITAKEKPAESEKFRMRTFLLRLGFIGPEYQQARKILTRCLSGNGSYARAELPAVEPITSAETEVADDE